MRIGDRYDLTYCSNIHAGETWDDVFAALVAALPVVRRHLQTDAAFAVGLRLSAAAAATLDRGETLQTFRKFLSDQNCYVPTINGFPYGAFHGTRVKERVYEPDWRDPRRVNYSNQLARILAALQAPTADRPVSISTVPGAFRDAAREPADRAAIARGILEHAVYLARLRDEMGVTVTLAIEPEPACVIETVSEAVTFFVDELLSAAAVSRMNQHHGSKLTSSEIARHVGICLDACHMAVEFEDPQTALEQLAAAGISVAKVQLSAALRVARTRGAASPHALLAPFAEDTYLHQVVIQTADDTLHRFTDLPDALQATREDARSDGEWRVHFHVPIFLDRMSGFATTQPYLAALLRAVRSRGISTCLEVETYTWDVLPREYRMLDMCEAIARELSWARQQIES
jgi:hypothetical protein